MSYYKSDYLYHHGIKGMKWGVRRTPEELGHKPETGTSNKKNRITRNIAIGVGAAVLVTAGSYFVNRYRQTNIDTLIKSGTDIQHMAHKASEMLNRPFYASYLKSDNKKYARNDLFGTHWDYKQTINSSRDLKVAGKKTSLKAFREWIMTDPEAQKKFGDATDKKTISKVYDKFNRNFNSPDMFDRALRDSYFSKLSQMGYDAVRDRNDQIYSHIRSPVMIFSSFGDMTVKSIESATKRTS